MAQGLSVVKFTVLEYELVPEEQVVCTRTLYVVELLKFERLLVLVEVVVLDQFPLLDFLYCSL